MAHKIRQKSTEYVTYFMVLIFQKVWQKTIFRKLGRQLYQGIPPYVEVIVFCGLRELYISSW